MPITRRDFLNGTALAIAAGLTPLGQGAAAADTRYPPALMGMRGSHPGAFETAHKLAREGETFEIKHLPIGESYDLVVVGGGIAGLSAAYFWHKRRPGDTILIIDNHDDFGGHAKRNEFRLDGKLILGYGGSESFQSPHSEWRPLALQLIRELGITLDNFEKDWIFHRTLYPDLGLSRAVWFNREDFGQDKLVTGDPTRGVDDDIPADQTNARGFAPFIDDMPISEAAKLALIRLYSDTIDYLPGLTVEEKSTALDKISYRDFLKDKARVPEDGLKAFQKRSHDFFGAGIDTIPASWAQGAGYPGFGGMGLAISDTARDELNDAYVHHFPDGNAGLARLLVKAMIPDVAPGGLNMGNIVLTRFDYAKLDRPTNRVRIRVSTTGARVENRKGGVDLGIVTGGTLSRIRAKRAILSCNAGIIPWICPELPEVQKTALSANVRLPLVYVNVLIRNWQSFKRLGAHLITAPMGFFPLVKLDYPVSLGTYAFSKDPSQPMVLHMVHVPVEPEPGQSARDQARLGRMRLLEMSFADFEAKIRDQLQRMLGPGGFDHQRDIAGITVNRWSHGYAYSPMPNWDDEAEFEGYAAAAKKRAGKIAIGLSDTGWDAYAHVAIAEAHRAVTDLLG
jgi:spermidine dehydrogenase